jgi:hypothetical protein
MQRRVIETVSVIWLAMLVIVPAVVSGQSAASGLAGVVKDTTGAVLPGVTVEAASPVLIEKVRTAVTDDQGQYKIIDLRPGTYTITFTLSGFASLRREGVELPAAFTATVNADLRVGAVEETITVSGQSPTVDVQSTLRQNVLSSQVLDSLPSLRTPQSFVPYIPGVVGGLGQIGRDTAVLSINGGRGAEANVAVDGTADHTFEGPGGAAFTYYINQASVQEVSVSIGGQSAEQGVSGITTNLIPKEGSNRFTGFLFVGYGDQNLQADNLTDDLRARGLTAVNSLKKIWDVNPAWGGPILRDKLWFYNAYRDWGSINYLAGLYYNATPLGWSYTPDLSRQAVTEVWDKSANLRLTWQASQKHKISLFYDHQPHCTCNRNFSATVAPEATQYARFAPNGFRQASWKSPFSNRFYLEASISQTFSDWETARQIDPLVADDTISVTTQAGAVSIFRADNNYGNHINFPIITKASASYVTGSHAFKAGFANMTGRRRHTRSMGGDVTYRLTNSSNGVPNQLTQWATPLEWLEDLNADLGIYAQDQWTTKRLTLNAGIRYDYLNASVPEQRLPATRFLPARSFQPVKNVPNWHDVSPRLGGSYDLFGDGKTAVKAVIGRYVAGQTVAIARANNPIETSVSSSSRTWNDADRDFVPDCDLRNQEANGECLRGNLNFGQPNVTATRYDEAVLDGWGARGYNWEFSTSVQRELRPGISVTGAYNRRWYGNFTVTDNLLFAPEDYDHYCITAPTDSRLPNGGGYQICDLWDIDPGLFNQSNNLVTFSKNYGTQREVYDGYDVTFSARLQGGALLSGGLNGGRAIVDNCFIVDSPSQRFCKTSPPFLKQFKMTAVYPLPWQLQLSAALQSVPGTQILAQYVATNADIRPSLGRNLAAGTNGNVTVDLIEPGTQYDERATNLDLRLARRFQTRAGRVLASVDVFNIFNSSDVLTLNNRFPDPWLRPTSILVGRWVKFGAQLDF